MWLSHSSFTNSSSESRMKRRERIDIPLALTPSTFIFLVSPLSSASTATQISLLKEWVKSYVLFYYFLNYYYYYYKRRFRWGLITIGCRSILLMSVGSRWLIELFRTSISLMIFIFSISIHFWRRQSPLKLIFIFQLSVLCLIVNFYFMQFELYS